MSYNGSGTFNINTAGQPVVTGTVISSSVFNALTADLATGLSTAITKDGQTTITNNIPFNGYKITNLGAGTASTDAVRLGQLQAGTATAITVTGTDTYTGTMSPALASYTAGNTFSFVVPNTNTTGCTLNIDGQGAKAITRDGSTALIAGDLVAGSEVVVIYDGTRFQVLNSNSKTNWTVSNALTLSGGTANGVAYLNGSKALTTGSALTFDGTNFNTPASVVSGSIGLLYGNTYSAGNSQAWFAVNSTASDTYRVADTAMRYRLLTGVGHVWETAPSGSIGGVITWSEQMRLTSTGLGIGTSSPATPLEVLKSQNAATRIRVNNQNSGASALAGLDFEAYGGNWNIDVPASTTFVNPLVFSFGSTERMRLDSSGNLGLGVTPSAWYLPSAWRALQVGNAGIFANLSTSDARYIANGYLDSGGTYRYINSAGASWYGQNSGAHAWYTAPSGTAGNAISFTQAMTLDSGGRLLIGTTSSLSSYGTLQVQTPTSATNAIDIIGVNGTSGMGASIGQFSNNLYLSSNWYYSGGQAKRVSGNGVASITLATDSSDVNTYIAFGTGGTSAASPTERARIDSSGNLLVGTTSALSPASGRVEICANGSSSSIISVGTGGTRRGYMYTQGTDLIVNSDTGNLVVQSGVSAPLIFGTVGTERARIDSSGNIGIGVIPEANSSGWKIIEFGAGSGSKYGAVGQKIVGNCESFFGWNTYGGANNVTVGQGYYYRSTGDYASLYTQNGNHIWWQAPTGTAGNPITFTQALTLNTNGALVLQGGNTSASGVGVTFPATQTASPDANTLDDYEEGTWTPVATASTAPTGVSYDYRGGWYRKIGSLVVAGFGIKMSSVGTGGSGELQIAGFPFTSAPNGPYKEPTSSLQAGGWANSSIAGQSYFFINDNSTVAGTRYQNNSDTIITWSELQSGTTYFNGVICYYIA